ncbi:bifunctional nuclease 2-like isoform X1 [Primulina eburnea]|uniref:bifunctional nuclease 2-like isoform X1 n=1 Tax=Primulina eburnea TaxID=1245227 RepID=UPI003C6CA2A2
MASVQGHVVCQLIGSKQTGVYSVPFGSLFLKDKLIRSRFLGLKGPKSSSTNAGFVQNLKKCNMIRFSFSSSSNGNGSTAENSNENDADYVDSSVIEAVEVKSDSDVFTIKMRDGKHLRCVHNNPKGSHFLDYPPHPAIVLKMEDGTGLLLPIIVMEMPSVLLMAAIRNVQIARPTMYQVVKDMTEKMGYMVKLVRVTKRVHEAYFSELHMVKLDNEAECVKFDLRPSDAINIAVRCKVPIQVNKFLAYNDGMRVVESATVQNSLLEGQFFAELDSCHRRPTGQPCIDTKEFDLVRNMLIAVVEERYRDAGIRSKLAEVEAVPIEDDHPSPKQANFINK